MSTQSAESAGDTEDTGTAAESRAAAAATAGAGGAQDTRSSAGTDGPRGEEDPKDTDGTAGAEGSEGTAPGLSEAEAELAAQRELQERIARRKAERDRPVEAGGRLSGQAADLLAAVRAVESGERPVRVFDTAEAAPRQPGGSRSPHGPAASAAPPAPVRGPEVSPATVEAVGRVLTEGGAPAALAGPVAAALGGAAAEELRADPWRLLGVTGVRPEQADGFARALLGPECGPGDERRGRALAAWLLGRAADAGHTCLTLEALAAALGRYAVPDPDAAVQDAIAEGELLVFQDPDPGVAAAGRDGTRAGGPGGAGASETAGGSAEGTAQEQEPVQVLVGLERYALAEESLADGLARLVTSAPAAVGDRGAEAWTAAAAAGPGAASGAAASSAVRGSTAQLLSAVAGHSLVLHTGGEAARAEPAVVVAAASALGLRVCAATHTADGRRRLAALLPADGGIPAGGTTAAGGATGAGSPGALLPGVVLTTVGGLLAGQEGPGRDAEGALAVDLLVVLDAPQLDVESAAALVESLPDGARLLLSGDPGVLWSAGAGRVFADLLTAGGCPHVASRIPDPGPVGELVSGIGAGELTQVEAPGREVVVVPVRDAGEAVHRTVQLVADSVPRTFGVPAGQTQVITPGHGGAAGTRVLNTALKERLNPGPGRFAGFDPGDRVAYAPAPGRTVPGRVVDADADGLHLEVEGTVVVVPKDRVEQSVRHGWALTAHQAVGLRCPAAVVVLPGDAADVLTRAWVYTAFGRGEQHLSVVQGADRALPRAVAERPAKPRTTRLVPLLTAQLTASRTDGDQAPGA